MYKAKISVIIPCYNSELYLEECLNSIKFQTLKEIEIICVNDGSMDNTENILYKYAQKDSRFRIIKINHQGAAIARNVGIETARGEYLAILDSDDIYDLQMLEKMYRKAQITRAEIVICKSQELNMTTKEISDIHYCIEKKFLPAKKDLFSAIEIKEHVFDFCVGWSWDKLFKKDFVEKYNLKFQNLRSSNDLLFVFLGLVLANGITIVDEKLVTHRRFTGTQLSETREKNPLCFFYAIEKLKLELKSQNLYNSYERSFVNWAVDFCFWHIRTINQSYQKEIKDFLKTKLPELIGEHAFDKKFFYKKRLYNSLQKLLGRKSIFEFLVGLLKLRLVR